MIPRNVWHTDDGRRASRSASVSPKELKLPKKKINMTNLKTINIKITAAAICIISMVVMMLVFYDDLLYAPCLFIEGGYAKSGITLCEFRTDSTIARNSLVYLMGREQVLNGSSTVLKNDMEITFEEYISNNPVIRTPPTHLWQLFDATIQTMKHSSEIRILNGGQDLSLHPFPSLFSFNILNYDLETIKSLVKYTIISLFGNTMKALFVPMIMLLLFLCYSYHKRLRQREVDLIVSSCYCELRNCNSNGISLLQLRRQVEANLRNKLSQNRIRSHWRFPGDVNGQIELCLQYDFNGVEFIKRNGEDIVKLREKSKQKVK